MRCRGSRIHGRMDRQQGLSHHQLMDGSGSIVMQFDESKAGFAACPQGFPACSCHPDPAAIPSQLPSRPSCHQRFPPGLLLDCVANATGPAAYSPQVQADFQQAYRPSLLLRCCRIGLKNASGQTRFPRPAIATLGNYHNQQLAQPAISTTSRCS